jgi:predicted RNase H-like nuclease (RuvC/YqgF family)
VKKPSGETFLGMEFTQKVTEETGNIVLSKKDFKEIKTGMVRAKKIEKRLVTVLKTDLYQENKVLKKEVKEQSIKNNADIDDYNKLVGKYNALSEENGHLKSHISDLKKEVRIIYNTIKNFLKERTSEIKEFKGLFKTLTEDISLSSKDNQVDSQFKKEFDEEYTPKRTQGRSR